MLIRNGLLASLQWKQMGSYGYNDPLGYEYHKHIYLINFLLETNWVFADILYSER